MLVVHWSPVSNTKTILKNGIKKSPNGLYCFPLSGHRTVDKWWANLFRYSSTRRLKKYYGFVFRLEEDDFPAYFGDWMGATNQDCFEKPIPSLAALEEKYRENILWCMGSVIADQRNIKQRNDANNWEELLLRLAEEEHKTNARTLPKLMNSVDFMNLSLQDLQIVLSRSIAPKRILKVLSQQNEFGRVLQAKKKNAKPKKYFFDEIL